ncbi:hypothetical protein PQC38_gp066 [Aeromonas phage BUCT695]|nr:hypothetical protein PQC38_gp066 [Aeromonas phage BUCT695]UIW10542.1 hypothetical protein [Aeromonas phage BUCT695]
MWYFVGIAIGVIFIAVACNTDIGDEIIESLEDVFESL